MVISLYSYFEGKLIDCPPFKGSWKPFLKRSCGSFASNKQWWCSYFFHFKNEAVDPFYRIWTLNLKLSFKTRSNWPFAHCGGIERVMRCTAITQTCNALQCNVMLCRVIHSKSESRDPNDLAKKFELSPNLSKNATKWSKNGQKRPKLAQSGPNMT